MNTELVKMTLHEMCMKCTQDTTHTKYRQNGMIVFMYFQAFNSLFRRMLTSKGEELNVI